MEGQTNRRTDLRTDLRTNGRTNGRTDVSSSPYPICPECDVDKHTTEHSFECQASPTHYGPEYKKTQIK